jgi:hypothetical protein
MIAVLAIAAVAAQGDERDVDLSTCGRAGLPTATARADVTPFYDLTLEESAAVRATAVAESARIIRQDRIDFRRCGGTIDDLPRVGDDSDAPIMADTPEEAAVQADAVYAVTSKGAFVDADGTFGVRLEIDRRIKGPDLSSLDLRMYGGSRLREGIWVLHIAPHELYLARGERAILFLRSAPAQPSVLMQRAYESIKLERGRVKSGDSSAWGNRHWESEASLIRRIEDAID